MKKTVCIIGPFPPPINGNSIALQTLTKSDLFKENFEIIKIDLNELYHGGKGRFNFASIFGMFAIFRKLKDVQKRYNINVFYYTVAQTYWGFFRDFVVLGSIKKTPNAKIVIHLHGGGLKELIESVNNIMKSLIRKAYKKADCGIVLSEHLRNMFDGVLVQDKIRVIENCVEKDVVISESEFNNKISCIENKDRLCVLYLSNMIPTKGYMDVLMSANECKKSGENVVFYFAGAFNDNKAEEMFLDYISDNSLQDTVKYMGIADKSMKKKLMKLSNIFVLPTYYSKEGMPISLLEAMANGLGVITTNYAGIKGLVVENINGLFVEPKSYMDIYRKIYFLYSNKELLAQMGINNRRKILDNYNEELYVSKVVDALDA